MNSDHLAENRSVWHSTGIMPEYSSLTENMIADVCIIGGGVAGLTSAYLLMKEGESVCILESSKLASGQSGRTTAHLTAVLDKRYSEIEKNHTREGARLVAESHSAALNKIEKIISEEKIDCDLQIINGYLFCDENTDETILLQELEAARRAGLNVDFLEKTPLPFITGPCLRFSHQLQFHPLKYLSAMAKLIIKGGGKIFTDTPVVDIHSGNPVVVKTKHGSQVESKAAIVATNTPINDLFAIHTKQAPYRTYAMAIRVPKGTLTNGLYWDTAEPNHYMRLGPDISDAYDILIVGGEDHKTGQEPSPDMHFNFIETWVRTRIPSANEVIHKWSGQIMESVDGIAYLGRNPHDGENVYIITGDSGNGMTSATVGALLITDQIMFRYNPWVDLYDPARISIRTTPTYIKENVNTLVQYKNWFTSKEKIDFQKLPREHGTVFRNGLKMIAAYKDLHGNIELMSASCPHLAGIVSWNSVEKSWDCPCHGSRFDCHGHVIEGPAHQDLKKIRASFPELKINSAEI